MESDKTKMRKENERTMLSLILAVLMITVAFAGVDFTEWSCTFGYEDIYNGKM